MTFVALLRGVNIGGKQIAMAALRRGLESIGLRGVQTYLQSGNVVFDAEDDDPASLAAAIHGRLAADFGHQVDVLVLRCEKIARIASSNPFLSDTSVDPRWLHATFLLGETAAAGFEQLTLPAAEGEQAVVADGVVFLYLPHGYGHSKLSNTYFERALRVPATTRNWRTVQALAALCAARQGAAP